LAIDKLKCRKSPDFDQIPGEKFQSCSRNIHSEIHKFFISVWNKEELPEVWKELIIVPIYKKGDKTDISNYRDISLSPTTYKILSNILLSRLTPFAEEIIGDHQCRFRRDKSTTDLIFCIHQILEKKLEYNKAVRPLFTNFKKAYDSLRRVVLYNILIGFSIPMKLVRQIKLYVTETSSRVQVGKNL
jgi:hypothetical protein